MSDRKIEDEPSTSQINKEESNVKDDEEPNQLAIAAAPNEGNEETRPQIFKLDVDCVQEVFDYLSIEDIHSVSETCIRMHKITGDYFETHLKALKLSYSSSNRNAFQIYIFNKFITVNGFKQFVHKLVVSTVHRDEQFRSIGLHCKLNLKSLKQIELNNLDLSAAKMRYFNPILNKAETVEFCGSNIFGEFYEIALQHCLNMKSLRINARNKNVVIGTNNNWLLRSYPTLEHFELHSNVLNIPELRTFFEQNPNLKKLSISERLLMQNVDAMVQSKIKLQVLALQISRIQNTIICHHLKQLNEHGIFQRLHVRLIEPKQPVIDVISSFNRVEELYLELDQYTPVLNLNSLINLKVLGLIYDRDTDNDLDGGSDDDDDDDDSYLMSSGFHSIAKKLVNLERLYIENIRSEIIEPFIQYSPKLRSIKVHSFVYGENFVDLSAWDKKREQLVGASTITIYLKNELYLAMKWSSKTPYLKMFQVKRYESYAHEKFFLDR